MVATMSRNLSRPSCCDDLWKGKVCSIFPLLTCAGSCPHKTGTFDSLSSTESSYQRPATSSASRQPPTLNPFPEYIPYISNRWPYDPLVYILDRYNNIARYFLSMIFLMGAWKVECCRIRGSVLYSGRESTQLPRLHQEYWARLH
jgi:hypothetical protein